MASDLQGSPTPASEAPKRESSGDSKPRTKKRVAKRAGNKRPPVNPWDQVLSGRLVVVAMLFAAMVFIPLSPLGMMLAKKAPTPTHSKDWKVGAEGTVHLTVITADYNKLACAHGESVGNYHCAFDGQKKPWPTAAEAPHDDNKKQIIQPYRTTDGSLILLAGLWAQPEVATRLHNEPPHAVTEKKLARFVVECRVKFLAEWEAPLVRWAPGQAWAPQGNGDEGQPKRAPIAEPLDCQILERKRSS